MIQNNSKQIAKNTLFLYFRTLLVMCITIFISRIVLDALGVDNYGIYNVVGGFVSMFSVLSGTLTAASQRFLSFELGKDTPQIRRVFSTTVTIHVILAVVIFVLLESLGVWFLNTKMNIASDRLIAANWVFQCSVITFCINLICIPYIATIIAYEKMSAFAYISILEVLAKLSMAYLLYIVIYDVLIVYAVLMLIVALLLQLTYSIYCYRTFKECRYNLLFDKEIFKNILGFSGWNFIGSTSGILNTQGINVLTNLFFGVALNAVRGVATQVDHAINSFVQNFMLALNPQITKSYSSGNFVYLNQLIIRGTKYATFLFMLIGVPIYIKVDYILSIWLVEVPQYASVFVRYALIYTMCQTLSQCLYIAMLATGKIKKYQLTVGTLSLMAFPMAYLFFKLGFPGEFGYVSVIIFSLVCLVARLFLLRDVIPLFTIRNFVEKVLVRVFFVLILIIGLMTCFNSWYNDENLQCLAWTGFVSVLVTSFVIYLIGLEKTERVFLKNEIAARLRR